LLDCLDTLRRDGFRGVQLTETKPPLPPSVAHCTLGRINTPAEADGVIGSHAGLGHTCLTVHACWGIEDDDEVDRLVEAILLGSEKYALPVYIETHRATITQDMWRTVRLTGRFPGVRLNGDFSHYYTGQEMVYGGLEMKLDFMEPISERIAFIHARIGSPGNIQVAIQSAGGRPPAALGDIDFLADFGYYARRTLQYSSLSPGICAVVAAMAGERGRAFQLFRLGAAMDLEDVKRETETGLHTACHGGAWLGVIAGFAGVRATEDALILRPRLPAHRESLSFTVHYRGARVEVHCKGDTATWQSDRPVTVRLD